MSWFSPTVIESEHGNNKARLINDRYINCTLSFPRYVNGSLMRDELFDPAERYDIVHSISPLTNHSACFIVCAKEIRFKGQIRRYFTSFTIK